MNTFVHVGDWFFWRFKLATIKAEVRDGLDFEVSDGIVMTWIGKDEIESQIRPLSILNMQISMYYYEASNRLHQKGAGDLNYPDIHRWLVREWLECTASNLADGQRGEFLTRLANFEKDILSRLSEDSGYGFPIVRPRFGVW